LTRTGASRIVVATLRELGVSFGNGSPGQEPERMGEAMAMAANDIERLIRARIPDAEVTIRDLAGDGDHYARPLSPSHSAANPASSSTRSSTRR
jgi:hypothetical protein